MSGAELTEGLGLEQAALARFRGELQEGEELLWHGRPGQGCKLRPQDLIKIPFTLPFGGAAIYLIWDMVSNFHAFKNESPVVILMLLILIAMASYFVFFRFLHDAYRRKYLYYGLTNRRALFMSTKYKNQTRTVILDELETIRFKKNYEGSHTIFLGWYRWWLIPPQYLFLFSRYGLHPFWREMGVPYVPSFEFIEDGERVFDLITEHRKA